MKLEYSDNFGKRGQTPLKRGLTPFAEIIRIFSTYPPEDLL